MNYLYCTLPSGNSDEFFLLDLELIGRGVDASISNLSSGGRMYKIPEIDLHLLPRDNKGHYLGNNNSGHSLYKMPQADYNRAEWGGTEWISLLQIAKEARNVAKEA